MDDSEINNLLVDSLSLKKHYLPAISLIICQLQKFANFNNLINLKSHLALSVQKAPNFLARYK